MLKHTTPDKAKDAFRVYESAPPHVAAFYRENHTKQTLDFVRARKAEFLPLRRQRLGIWDAVAALEQVVDESDPDIGVSQLAHALQTSEALRRDGASRVMVLTGFVHDLGKVLCLFGEPQWAVVGDTFPVGCAFSERIVHGSFFAENPDAHVPGYATRLGIYREGCGLDAVHLSWGHDEYLYHVLRPYLPEDSLYVIRHHSFYAAHRERAYAWLMDARDRRLMDVVRAFNPYDLYSKSAQMPDWTALRPWYEELVAEFLPPVLQW